METSSVSGRARATRLTKLVVFFALFSVLLLAALEVIPAAAQGPSSYVLILRGPQGPENYDQSVAAFRSLAESGLSVSVLRYFGGLGVGGVFSSSDQVASRIEGLLHPLLLLKSGPVSLGTESLSSGEVVDGFDYFAGGNVTGAGVKVAVIDTGVDYDHPALGGAFGVKVVGGYNFVDDDTNITDDDGHGTAVSGIIAGNSSTFKGVAPGAELLVYKVFSQGETSTDLIVEALDQAAKDGAKVVNLSLGGGFASEDLETVGQLLYSQGIELVAAIGNDGPDPASVEAPGDLGSYYGVGASVSLATTDPQAEMSIDGTVLLSTMAMNDTPVSNGVITAPTTFIENGRPSQVEGLNLTGRIAVSLRDHLTYFSTMEEDAADAGALALVVVNDSPYSFTENGTTGGPALASNNTAYSPRIPVVAISGEEGSSIASSSGDGTNVSIAVFRPTTILYPAFYSSLGPSDDFSIKPEILAPGDNVVAPLIGSSGYVEVSGTSFSAPQVAGTLALIAQLHPNITSEEAFSMVTLAATVAGGYFGVFPESVQGAGVLNISKTLSLPFALDLHYMMLFPSATHSYSQVVELQPFDGGRPSLSYSGPYPLSFSANGTSSFSVTAGPSSSTDEAEDRIQIAWGGISYSLPVRIIPGDLWLGYDTATDQLYSTYNGSTDATVTVELPDGSMLQGTLSASHNYSFLPVLTGVYRVTVSATGSNVSQVGHLELFSTTGPQVAPSIPSDTFPDFVPLGVVAFSAFVALLAAALYFLESLGFRSEGPPSAPWP